MNNLTANNPIDALRHARRAESARQIIEEGYTFWKDEELDSIAVCKPGRLAASYFINTVKGTCECPDYLRHGDTCKHLLAAALIEAEDAEMDRRAAEDEEERFFNPFVNASH